MGKNPLEIRPSSLGHPYFSHINGSYHKEINEGAIDISLCNGWGNGPVRHRPRKRRVDYADRGPRRTRKEYALFPGIRAPD